MLLPTLFRFVKSPPLQTYRIWLTKLCNKYPWASINHLLPLSRKPNPMSEDKQKCRNDAIQFSYRKACFLESIDICHKKTSWFKATNSVAQPFIW